MSQYYCLSWKFSQIKTASNSFIRDHQVSFKKTMAIGITLASLTSQPLIAISAVGEGQCLGDVLSIFNVNI